MRRALLLLVVAAATVVAPPATAAQEPEPILGGGSFNSAPLIEPGTYTDTLLANEYVFYAFEIQKGQRARVRAQAQHDGMGGGAYFLSDFYGPLRRQTADRGFEFFEDGDPVDLLMEGGEVGGRSPSWQLPGRYYWMISLDRAGGLFGREFPFVFTLVIDGEPALDPTPTDAPMDVPRVGGDAQSPTEPTPTAPSPAPTTVESLEPQGAPLALGGVGGLLIGAVIGGSGRLWLRRRH